jgi:hypothetical protein
VRGCGQSLKEAVPEALKPVVRVSPEGGPRGGNRWCRETLGKPSGGVHSCTENEPKKERDVEGHDTAQRKGEG